MIKKMGFIGLMLATTTACSVAGMVSPNPSASPSASSSGAITIDGQVVANLPSPLEIATATGIKANSCAEESSLKSGSGPSTNIKFKNSSSAQIRVYWLDGTGKRVEYINGQQAKGNGGLKAGASFDQQTYVTHPWVITTDNGNCLGIYTPTDTSNVTLDITKTVNITGSVGASGSSSGTGTTDPVTGSASELRVRQSIECLKAKGKTAEAGVVQGSLNLYLEAQKQGGLAIILGNGHLTQAIRIAAEHGC